MRSAVVLFALLLAAPALAQSYTIGAFSYCDQKHVPPVGYDYEPNVQYEVVPADKRLLNVFCDMTWAPVGRVGACVHVDEFDGYRIYVRDDLTNGERACVMRHERAHVNGWVHTYSDTKPYPRGRVGHMPLYTPAP